MSTTHKNISPLWAQNIISLKLPSQSAQSEQNSLRHTGPPSSGNIENRPAERRARSLRGFFLSPFTDRHVATPAAFGYITSRQGGLFAAK